MMGEVVSLIASELRPLLAPAHRAEAEQRRACPPEPGRRRVIPLFAPSAAYVLQLRGALAGHHRALAEIGARIREAEACGAEPSLLRAARAQICERWRAARDQLRRVEAALAMAHPHAEAPGEDAR